jgi:formylglycine-generating enzyme required for sulfatase activity
MILHRPTGLRFVLVPGGELQMGLTAKDCELLDLFLGSRRSVLAMIDEVRAVASPVVSVQVAPFLCAQVPLDQETVRRLDSRLSPGGLGALSRSDALGLAERLGFRLPSDAELEWIARQGAGASFVIDTVREAPEEDEEHVMLVDHPEYGALGLAEFHEEQWAADDWFPNHEGRPETAIARTGGDPQGVKRFEVFDYEEIGSLAILNQLSARRVPGNGGRALVRLACDLPEAALEILRESRR